MGESNADPSFQKLDSTVVAAAFYRVEIVTRKLITAGKKVCVYFAGGAQACPVIPKTKPAYRGIPHFMLQR